MPDGWETAAFIERALSSGFVSYDKLLDGTVSIAELFRIHEMLDYRDCRELTAREKARGTESNGRH